jgi:hypothetical protein
MKVLCKIREIDNVVKFNNSTYHFVKVDGVDGLVCDVQDDEAVKYMLELDPVFSLMDPAAAVEVEAKQEEEQTQMQHDTQAADREAYELMTLEELQDLYKERFGKASHPATKHETLVEKLLASSPANEEE